MKLLWYGETMFIQTGAGQVAKQLLPVFQEVFSEIHLVPINQWWIQENLPAGLTITPGNQQDNWNLANAKQAISMLDYDCLFLTTDLNRISDLTAEIEKTHKYGIPVLMYGAMDTHVFQPAFFHVLELASIPVVFSEWCKRLVLYNIPALAEKLHVIYHGTEPDTFFPLAQEERQRLRKEYFSIEDDSTFVVVNVNRNQVRKDLARTMAAFHLFHLEVPDSLLYLHSKQQDVGGNLPSQAQGLGLRVQGAKPEVIFAPLDFNETNGVSREDLNKIYNSADCFLTTSTGEGWGLTTTEAMSAGTPVVGPDNTVFPEIMGEWLYQWFSHFRMHERGILVESGGPDLWTTFYGISDTPREICSTTGAMAALQHVHDEHTKAIARAADAWAWTLNNTWEHKRAQWRALLCHLFEGAAEKRSLQTSTV